eukprot:01868.XXX_9816_11426_1 [CDS] Oithona nana genome sequencing.
MAPTLITDVFPQRKLRSSSLATPKKTKNSKNEENTAPKTEVKKRPGASPIKKRSSSVSTPLKSLQLNSPQKQKLATQLFQENSSPKQSLYRPDLSRLAEARASLSTSHPDQVVGREKQTKILRDFLEDNLTIAGNKTSSKKSRSKVTKKSIYVSGPPGTGKTTSLKRLLAEIPLDKKIRTVFVNCMTLNRSGGIFCKVADAVCPKKTYSSPIEAQKILEEEVVKSSQTILLVLDEVDQLDSKSQDVLYSLFELPYLAHSKLILVGIANSLDLTDRILPRLRIREAFCPAELTFPAYSTKEILDILNSRLSKFQESDKPLFQAGALKMCALKISSYSGDIRKALDVCRRALELAEIEARKQRLLKPLEPGQQQPGVIQPIGVPKIIDIMKGITGSIVTTALKNGTNDELSLQQKLLVASLLLLSRTKTNKTITMGRLHQTYVNVCKKKGMDPIDFGEANSQCGLLESRGMIEIKKGGAWASHKDRRVGLRIDEGEVEAALKDKTLLSAIISDVSCIAK